MHDSDPETARRALNMPRDARAQQFAEHRGRLLHVTTGSRYKVLVLQLQVLAKFKVVENASRWATASRCFSQIQTAFTPS